MVGEGIKLAGVLALLAGTGYLIGIGVQKLGREWSRMIDADLGGDAERQLAHDAALIPELAAARFGRSGCGCRACKDRGQAEPCSDYDGD